MTLLRTKCLDPDNRRDPKTDHFCCACQKDMDPAKPYRTVHCIDGGMIVLHPGDEDNYVEDNGEMGFFPIGNDCARRLGLEWTHPPKETEK